MPVFKAKVSSTTITDFPTMDDALTYAQGELDAGASVVTVTVGLYLLTITKQ